MSRFIFKGAKLNVQSLF